MDNIAHLVDKIGNLQSFTREELQCYVREVFTVLFAVLDKGIHRDISGDETGEILTGFIAVSIEKTSLYSGISIDEIMGFLNRCYPRYSGELNG